MGKDSIAIIGSGNWGSAIARLAGNNVRNHSDAFEERVRMWVYEEEFEGKKLTEIINNEHENRKYLPGVKLPDNVQAIPDIGEAVRDATVLIFVMPHQFLSRTLDQMEGKVTKGIKAVSLAKGVDVHGTNIKLFADLISERLEISCDALSGANIANEVARDRFSETTIGVRKKEDGDMWKKLFTTAKFRVSIVDDVAGVSLCGALKNIVAVAAGLLDGLGWGDNSKAAIMRIGLMEMKHFCQEFFEGVKEETFLEQSAGVADVITSCLGGRNMRVASAFAAQPGKSFEDLEKEMLNGQKLQGIHTAKEVSEFLKARNRVDAYPLFRNVFEICWEDRPVDQITDDL